MKIALRILLGLSIVFAGSAIPLRADSLCVDSARSHFRIRVASAGMFSGFGHDHLIEAKEIKGCAEIDWNQLNRSSVSLTFSTPAIMVLDPDHEKDRPKVQETMQTEVLSIKEFPEVRFKSTAVHAQSGGVLTIEGQLMIRDHTQNVSISLKLEQTGKTEARVTGKYALKLSAFGIKPISVMGGLVKVKDEIELEFDLTVR